MLLKTNVQRIVHGCSASAGGFNEKPHGQQTHWPRHVAHMCLLPTHGVYDYDISGRMHKRGAGELTA